MTKLQHYRQKKGVKASWLAKKLGISHASLWRYENGKQKTPTSIIFHAAHLLHEPVENFYNSKNG